MEGEWVHRSTGAGKREVRGAWGTSWKERTEADGGGGLKWLAAESEPSTTAIRELLPTRGSPGRDPSGSSGNGTVRSQPGGCRNPYAF